MLIRRLFFYYSLITNPKRIFLIDAFGALLSTITLFGILTPLEQYFGIPKKTLYVLSAFAFCLFTYSVSCYKFIKANWKPFLRILVICNILYLIFSLVLLIKHSKKITKLGWSYFTIELILIGIIIFLEYRCYLIDNKN